MTPQGKMSVSKAVFARKTSSATEQMAHWTVVVGTL